MAAPPKEGGTFMPEQIARITGAYETALRIVEGDDALRGSPRDEIERRLIGIIYAEARHGPAEVDHLVASAIRSLRLLSPRTWQSSG